MTVIKKKKLRTEISNIIKVNHEFNDVIDSFFGKYELEKNDSANLIQLKNHLENMNIIFSQMKDNVK